jgi:hypothetical protein
MEFHEATDEQLWGWAKRYDAKATKSMTRLELEEAVQIAVYKHDLALQDRAKAERLKDIKEKLGLDPQTKAKPAPETIAIVESPKVYAMFMNLEEKGVDVTFNKGCTHTFHLWHGFIHVLPKCIIDESRDMNVPSGKTPVHGKRRSIQHPGLIIDTIIGHDRRYSFEILDEKPPKNAAFGVVLNRKLYEKCGVPFPQPETAESVA